MQYSICDFILDIGQNSIEAKANVITMMIMEEGDTLSVTIGDDGCGMDKDTLKRVKDPFFTDGVKHKQRKVGLGIPFLIQSIETVGGEFDIKSNPGMGTSIYFSFDRSNIDCPPLGDIPGTILSLMIFDGDYELRVSRKFESDMYTISKSDLIDALGNLHDSDSLILAKKFLLSNEEDLIKMEA